MQKLEAVYDLERANREAETTTLGRTTGDRPKGSQPVDLQAMIDELRAKLLCCEQETLS